MRPDLDELDRQARAERLRDRDRHREPPRSRPRQYLRRYLVELACPTCAAPLYAPAGSDRAPLDCIACGGQLITRFSGGVVSAVTLADELDERVVIDPERLPECLLAEPELAAGPFIDAFDALEPTQAGVGISARWREPGGMLQPPVKTGGAT